MVVEDEPGIYEVLLAMFEMWGIGGIAFVDGEEALAWIEDVDEGRAKGEKPELALVDIRLPGAVQGEMVGARIRQSSQLKDMAIVLITAYHLTNDMREAIMRQSGADELLYKPLPRFSELKQKLEDVLAARRLKQAAVKAAGPSASGLGQLDSDTKPLTRRELPPTPPHERKV
jgi:CheY-like chemotaxis protein